MTDSNEPSWKTDPRCDEDQLAILRRCSKAKDITEWNDWRKANREVEVWLQGAHLWKAHLEEADLFRAHLEGSYLTDAHVERGRLRGAYLGGAHLLDAHLEGAYLNRAHLEGADLYEAHLEGADVREAHLEGASLREAHLEGAKLILAYLGGANLRGAHMANADLVGADLRNAVLSEADVRGASLKNVRLEGADLAYLGTDGMTLIDPAGDGAYHAVDRETYTGGVALANIRISPGVRQLLEYNVRRVRWLQWCGGRRSEWGAPHKSRWRHWAYRCPVWLFWQMSDYGRSTGRIALWFITLSLVFAAVYFLCGLASPPGIVEGLFDYERGGQIVRINDPALVFLRAAYFSVVTMTTLGFGDINAQPLSYAGHLLLMLQVILGYVLLGALVCRLAILFQAGGPAAKFTKPPKPEAEETGEPNE